MKLEAIITTFVTTAYLVLVQNDSLPLVFELASLMIRQHTVHNTVHVFQSNCLVA